MLNIIDFHFKCFDICFAYDDTKTMSKMRKKEEHTCCQLQINANLFHTWIYYFISSNFIYLPKIQFLIQTALRFQVIFFSGVVPFRFTIKLSIVNRFCLSDLHLTSFASHNLEK